MTETTRKSEHDKALGLLGLKGKQDGFLKRFHPDDVAFVMECARRIVDGETDWSMGEVADLISSTTHTDCPKNRFREFVVRTRKANKNGNSRSFGSPDRSESEPSSGGSPGVPGQN